MDLTEHNQAYERVQRAIEDYKNGRMVIMIDDEDRENEGDLTIAAERITPEIINFMARYGRGLICLSLTDEQVRRLNLTMMSTQNNSKYQTGFTVSIEAGEGVTTGISAADRALTIQTAINPACRPGDIVTPGHVFPIRARNGGVLVRTGHTEGSVDLAKLAGLNPSAVICEILNDDGTMARVPDLEVFKEKHNLNIVSIADIIKYRTRYESLIHMVAESTLPTKFGLFNIRVYENDVDDYQHIALMVGAINPDEPVMVRVHSECLTGDIFGSMRCDCGTQLQAAMKQIAEHGCGVIMYIRQEGRGIGLVNKIKSYNLQDQGYDTVEANEQLGFKPDLRDYGIGAQVLASLNIKKIRLMTNNPKKIIGLKGYGIEIVDRVAIECLPSDHNLKYLKAKKKKMGHMLKKV
ncbi:MAG: bifunctional 3,4-dihydroxy-2-butanone-4-phosphate synthase/GTP cyclohydrolase II [Deltaproteobacteria bacterium]|nr:bifunctional 3,4-dihydroxy-2-butanone-4-phosphate synthase/GTP cyclohydrolase II [Deltaproteobacteria bacterium]